MSWPGNCCIVYNALTHDKLSQIIIQFTARTPDETTNKTRYILTGTIIPVVAIVLIVIVAGYRMRGKTLFVLFS